MVVAEEMSKPTLKVSMGDSESSSEEESEISDNDGDSESENVEADANSASSNDGKSESDVSENESDDDDDSDESVPSNDDLLEPEVTNQGRSNSVAKSVGSSKLKNKETLAEADSEDDESDAKSVSSNDEKPEGLVTNERWADSVTKILGSSKPKNKKTLVLSRAKKYTDIVKSENEEKPSFEVIGESSEKKIDIKKEVPSNKGSSEPPVKKVKIEKPSIRHKPNILEKDRERLLSKIATKGVVQLFNAVRNQQKTLEKDLDRPDLTEGKKQKILKNFDKRTFLDTLMGKSKSIVVDDEAKSLKDEVKHEDDKPKWGALRDDFMMGAKMKDWDKESVDE